LYGGILHSQARFIHVYSAVVFGGVIFNNAFFYRYDGMSTINSAGMGMITYCVIISNGGIGNRNIADADNTNRPPAIGRGVAAKNTMGNRRCASRETDRPAIPARIDIGSGIAGKAAIA